MNPRERKNHVSPRLLTEVGVIESLEDALAGITGRYSLTVYYSRNNIRSKRPSLAIQCLQLPLSRSGKANNGPCMLLFYPGILLTVLSVTVSLDRT